MSSGLQKKSDALPLLRVVLLMLAAVFVARLFALLADSPGEGTAESRKEFSKYIIGKYLEPSEMSHQARRQRSIRSAAAVLSAARFTGRLPSRVLENISFGRWWTNRPGGFCVADGCPCEENLPCFETCDNLTGCADPSGTKTENPPINSGLANAVVSTLPGTAKPADKSQVAYESPRQIVVLLDLSEGMARTFGKNPPEQEFVKVRPAKSAASAGQISATEEGREYLIDPQGETAQFRHAKEFIFGIISHFEKVRAPLDKLFIIGFHESAAASIGPVPSSAFSADAVRETFMPIGVPISLEQVSRITDAQIKLGLFPRPDRSLDLPEALQEALKSLRAEASFGFSLNNVILVTAGLAACQHSVDPKDGKLCDPQKLGACETKSCSLLTPNNERAAYADHVISVREALQNVAAVDYLQSGVKLHVALVGDAVVPHSVLIPNPEKSDGRCLSDGELRLHHYPGVTWLPFTVPGVDPNFIEFQRFLEGTSNQYSQPNALFYPLASVTQGTWAPIRPPCSAPPYGYVGDLNHNGVDSDVDDYCIRTSQLPAFADQPSYLDDDQLATDYRVYHQELVVNRITDQEGRVLCDLQSSGYRDQGERLVDTIFAGADEPSFAVEP